MDVITISTILGVYTLIVTGLGSVALSFIKSWMNGVTDNIRTINGELEKKAEESFVFKIKNNQEEHDRKIIELQTTIKRCKNCNK